MLLIGSVIFLSIVNVHHSDMEYTKKTVTVVDDLGLTAFGSLSDGFIVDEILVKYQQLTFVVVDFC
jgi:hypothetical protein